ncbi:ABC-type antimicrobial peptide transport system [Collimonas arenae]|uniref:ABC-type antimicrobial peptide transport system n=2 Tax=Collimonas arenae TaxID=279058 RepID=A0A0A1FD13_9BURK|nr:ABC-type antimicrobial peptide transport system [Collimonas arenae]
MKYFSLIWASLFRKKARTILTLLSIIVAFLLFGLLQAVSQAFNGGADNADADRMITNSKYSIIDMLPIAFQQQIEAVPGVKAVAFASWFGGSYQDKPARFAVFPVVPDEYLKIAPELQMSPETRAAWNANRTGAVVGETLAKQMNWKVGDKVPLLADIWPKTDGSLTWTFDIVGTFHNTKDLANGDSALLFRYDYFDEARQYGKGTIGWFLVKIDDRSHSDAVGKAIDAKFNNSGHETKTQTEQAFAQGFAKQFGDIALIVSAILGAVFFTILVLTGNTMSQALRERIPELGILKTLGFSNQAVWWLVMLESLLLSVLGAAIGLLLAVFAIDAMKESLSGFGITRVSWRVVAEGFLFAFLLGLLVGLAPALKAMRLKIVDALRA